MPICVMKKWRHESARLKKQVKHNKVTAMLVEFLNAAAVLESRLNYIYLQNQKRELVNHERRGWRQSSSTGSIWKQNNGGP